ncbi:MAG: uroporphyrinogen-III C-methyltransferase [Chitinophagaceae bacterium]|nr:uroporphyrinogen-III C-methyltransferase [Chitinophagaceae bacterium]
MGTLAQQTAGWVTLAGAGPGDAELITLRLARRLAEADVILTDRLVNADIIHQHASPGAEVIVSGKKGYSSLSMQQSEICELMITHAFAGKKVVRLKGGDVAIFSNVLDELEALTANQIPFDIIPGITAASAASAYTGIPLTARGISQGVQFLSFHASNFYSSEKWKSLASTNDTLVFYMSARKVTDLAELLLRYTRKPDTPIAVVEQASTIHQRFFESTLRNCAAEFAGIEFCSPSLVIIGDVVSLHKQFNWFKPTVSEGSVFVEL